MTIAEFLFAVILTVNAAHAVEKIEGKADAYSQMISTKISYGSKLIPGRLWAWNGKRTIPLTDLKKTINIVVHQLPFIRQGGEHVTNLIVETAAVESMLGSAKLDGRVGLGVFGILEKTANYRLSKLDSESKKSIMRLFNKKKSMRWNLIHNVPFSAAIALLVYSESNHGLKRSRISSVHRRGALWKEVYNTSAGKGTVSGYVHKASYTH